MFTPGNFPGGLQSHPYRTSPQPGAPTSSNNPPTGNNQVELPLQAWPGSGASSVFSPNPYFALLTLRGLQAPALHSRCIIIGFEIVVYEVWFIIKLKLHRRSSKFQACPSAAAYLASAVNSHRRDCRPVAAYLFTKWVFSCLAFLQLAIIQACAYWQTFPSHILSFCGAMRHTGPGGEAFQSGGEKIKSLMKLKIIFQPILSAGFLRHSVNRMECWSRGRSSCVRACSEGLQVAVGQSSQVVLLS